MNAKKVVFFLFLTVLFPVTILVSAAAVTLRTMYEFVHMFALFICESVDKFAEWADAKH